MTQKKVRGHGGDVAVKKDRRTKAELIKQLDIVIETNSKLMQQRINPNVIFATDNGHYVRGYKDGVDSQKKLKWWRW